MKAIVLNRNGGPDILKLADVDKPAVKDGEILIRIRGAVVSPTDCVSADGKGVTRFAVGDRVYGSAGMGLGAYAEYISLPEGAALARMPANLDYAEAPAFATGRLRHSGFCGTMRKSPLDKASWSTVLPGRWAPMRYSWPDITVQQSLGSAAQGMWRWSSPWGPTM